MDRPVQISGQYNMGRPMNQLRILKVVCKVFVTKHYAPMVPVYQYLSQVSSLVFISTVVMLDVWIMCIVKIC